MAAIIQATNFTVPEEYALNMRGLQTDAYGEVKGGHKAIFDFAAMGDVGPLAVGYEAKNLVFNGDPAVVTDAWDAGITAAAKGLKFSTVADQSEILELPDCFDLNTLGTDPSFVISTWLTLPDTWASKAPPDFIMGYASNSTTANQWSLSGVGSSVDVRMVLSSDEGENTAQFDPTAYLGTPIMLSWHVRKIATGTFELDFYLGASRIAGQASRVYGFNIPASVTPRIGSVGAFDNDFAGTVHRTQLFKFDPETFDIDEWLADEIAGNGSRFAQSE